MAQKLITLDEAIEILGITKERINELRESGKISGYRDGASWKFRSADIERLQADGIDDLAADESFSMSDSALGLPSGSAQAQAPTPPSDDLELGDLELGDLELGDLELGESEPLAPQAGGSDLSMLEEEPQDPTATMEDAEIKLTEGMDEGSDADVLGIEPLGPGDDAESILLSEAERGEPLHRPASTIIGRSELAKMQADDAARRGGGVTDDDDDDLDLALVDERSGKSDVRLASSVSDVHSMEDSGVLGASASANKAKFEDLDELEIDLEAESSRILEAEDVAKAQAAAAKLSATGQSDLKLDDDFGLAGASDLGLAASSSIAGSVKPQPTKPEPKKAAPPKTPPKSGPKKEAAVPGLSALGLTDDDEDDFVLGDSGSDMSLSAGDSGINLRPSDSGISLGEAPIDLGGSALGSSLNLGAALSSAAIDARAKKQKKDEEFLLTPLEAEEAEEEEDSSQIIALDDLEEGEAPGFVADEEGDDAGFEGFEDAGTGGFGAPAMAGAGVAGEQQFGGVVNTLLVLCLMAMTLCGALVVDLFNSLWSWKEPFALNSSIMDGLLSMIGK